MRSTQKWVNLSKLNISLFTALFVMGLGGISACGDDGLGGAFVPDDIPPDEYGAPSTIPEDSQLWYHFATSFRPSTGAGEGGLITGEKQASGEICIDITDILDTASEDYYDQSETLIEAKVKAVGTASSSEIVVTDQDAPEGADPTVVDNALKNMWLKKITIPSRNHGFASPQHVTFRTQMAPVPDAGSTAAASYTIDRFPFFETRLLEEKNWSGWQALDDVEGAQNYIGGMYTYFMDNFGGTSFVTGDDFRLRHQSNLTCDGYTDSMACQNAQCYWDWGANSNAGGCISIFSINVTWRETITDGPAELVGNVVHKVKFDYTAEGILRYAFELIVPDANPSAALPADGALNQCPTDASCATGTLELRDLPWSDAYCTF
ncbi:hypothetical protein KAI87_00775 [Myxococcota bacterium]|nr:hypothetical protein [Myxococcota bacterium]